MQAVVCDRDYLNTVLDFEVGAQELPGSAVAVLSTAASGYSSVAACRSPTLSWNCARAS